MEMMTLRVLGLVLLIKATVNAEPIGRVVNGTDATIERYPFMISLRIKPFGLHSCGGSIVAPNYAITAAHCTDGRKAEYLTIQYGVTNINANGPNVVQVKRIIQHKKYNPFIWLANDISLLEVEHPFPIDYKTVAPVRLPKFNFNTPQLPEGGPGILAGWGLNATRGSMMSHLQEVNLKIYSNDECRLRHNGRVTENHICGGVDEGGKGQCSGDSGGPLLFKEGDLLTLVGVVSWSIKPCTVAPYPGVYTKVANFVDWIMYNMIVSN